MNKILIDTTSNKEIRIGLEIKGKKYQLSKTVTSNKNQVVLPMIERMLIKHKLKLSELTSIQVNSGPGSYTGIRVGIAIAQALSFALKIPVNGKMGFVSPKYE